MRWLTTSGIPGIGWDVPSKIEYVDPSIGSGVIRQLNRYEALNTPYLNSDMTSAAIVSISRFRAETSPEFKAKTMWSTPASW